MYDYIIATDSTADLPESFLREKEIPCFHLTYSFPDEGKSYGPNGEMDPYEFYEKVRHGSLPVTSQVNPEEAKDNLLKLMEQNKKILYLAFSSGLSGTYNSVRLAADEIMEEDPEAKIIVIDTLAASMGEGLLVYYAVKMRDEGKSLDEVAEWVESHKLNLLHVFTVDDLYHLHRGGRVSKTTAFVGTVLSIKPVLHVDDEGHLIAIGKERGRRKALLELVKLMEEGMGRFKDENKIFFISHSACKEDAEFVRDEIINRFGIKENMINLIGPTIGSHTGIGTVALFFLGEKR